MALEKCTIQQNDMENTETMERILAPLQLVINLLSRASRQPGPEIVSIREYQTIADYLIFVAEVVKKELGQKQDQETTV